MWFSCDLLRRNIVKQKFSEHSQCFLSIQKVSTQYMFASECLETESTLALGQDKEFIFS